MTTDEMIELMNQDLKNEYKHMMFYLRSSVMVRGLHRQSIQGFLSGEATSEMGHVTQFSTKIRSHLIGFSEDENRVPETKIFTRLQSSLEPFETGVLNEGKEGWLPCREGNRSGIWLIGISCKVGFLQITDTIPIWIGGFPPHRIF